MLDSDILFNPCNGSINIPSVTLSKLTHGPVFTVKSPICISTERCFMWRMTWEQSVRPKQRAKRAAEKRRGAAYIQVCVCVCVRAPLSECGLVCHLPSTSALVPNDGGVQRANYPHSGASPQASATSLHQGLPSSRFTLGPFQRHTHTHIHRAQ